MKNIILILLGLSLLACVSTSEYDKPCTSYSGNPLTTNTVSSVVKIDPIYPANANQAGYVRARFSVGQNGRPQNIKIFESEPAGLYDSAAINAIKQWHYTPVCQNGIYVTTPNDVQQTEVKLRFPWPVVTMDTVNKALQYLKAHTNDVKAEDINIEASSEALQQITTYLDNNPHLSNETLKILREARGDGLKAINFKRHYINTDQIDEATANERDAEVNKQEVMLAIEDIEFVNQARPYSERYRDMAGMASVLLKDYQLSNRYYEYCAEMKNAACMNILAAYSFYGMEGNAINPEKSIYLHKQTFKSATSWGCAGYYSATHLADISYFTQFDTGDTWQNWYKKGERFLPILKKKFNKDAPCSSVHVGLHKYISYLGEGEVKTDYLDNALSLEPAAWVIELISELKANTDLNEPSEYFFSTKAEPTQCNLGMLLVMFAHVTKNEKLIKIQTDNFTDLDKTECKDEYLMLNYANWLPEHSKI